MTDIKPFVNRESPSPRARSVSVVFSVKGLDAQQPQSPGMLDPLGSTCLFDRMLSVLLRVGEAEHKAVWFDDAALVERFEKTSHPSIRLLSGPPERCLRGGSPEALWSTHVLLLDGRHPFLRSSTIDEAIRLIRVRSDIEGMQSCVRMQGPIYSLTGESLTNGSTHLLVACPAFAVVPSNHLATGRSPGSWFPFEISKSESFRADTLFHQEMAGALIDARERRESHTAH